MRSLKIPVYLVLFAAVPITGYYKGWNEGFNLGIKVGKIISAQVKRGGKCYFNGKLEDCFKRIEE